MNSEVYLKTCYKCKEAKVAEDEYSKDISREDGYSNKCKQCDKEYRKSKKGKYSAYKKLSKDRGLKFSLTFEQFVEFWQKSCKYCGNEIKTIGLDRMDNTKGYVAGNVQPCCHVCNMMKSDLEENMFLEHIQKIIKKREDE